MEYKICSREKDIMSIMWNVFASFGYSDAVEVGGKDKTAEGIARLAIDNGLSCKVLLCNCINDRAMAEIVAMSIEAAEAVEFPDFSLKISCSEAVKELLYLYSLDEYCQFTEGEFSFAGISGDTKIFEGGVSNCEVYCSFDLSLCGKVMEDSAVGTNVPETIIYPEDGADGIAYEIAYTMRLSGCLATSHLSGGTIEECEAFSKSRGIESIIRVFADGKIQIKDFLTGTVTETDYNTFVGYYEEDEHEHHHHHDCDCGHCH